jgi:hypothetical protein
MSSRMTLILAVCVQFAALPALAQGGPGPGGPGPGGGGAAAAGSGGGAGSGEGNVDWRTSGPIGSTGGNDAAAVIGTGPQVGVGYGTLYYQPQPPGPPKSQTAQMPSFIPGSYPSVSDCLTAAYAAGQPLGRCERR